MSRRGSLRWILTVFVLALLTRTTQADEGIEFFEKKIRPVLVEHCYECHSGDAKSLKGGLLLEYREQLLKGGDNGPAIVNKKPDMSLLIKALRWESFEMPPKGKLPERVIKDFESWVRGGAPWPRSDKKPTISGPVNYDWAKLQKGHWAFQTIVSPKVPGRGTWGNNAIDAFVGKRLVENGLTPSPPASPSVLIRRMYFDMLGMPPTPGEVADFCRQYQQNAFGAVSALTEKLLASPHYGERWGRHWLDVARYSDGFGASQDGAALPDAWRYRDWVIESLNADIRFVDFIRMQIAGDLLNKNKVPQATGFIALGPTYSSDGGDPDSVAQAKSETLDDRVDTLTRGLLGITASCSRCHDHKFDPIPQLDYYSVAGIFNNTAIHRAPLAADDVVRRYDEHQKQIKDRENRIRQLDQKLKKEKRKPSDEEEKQKKSWQTELVDLKKTAPPMYPTAHALRDTGSGNMKVAIRGNLRKTGSEAPRRFFRILGGENPPLYTQGSGRLELAESIVSANNPLTARVFVNRIWQHHFGQALVRTPSNFGKLGESPTHPELLDWLASQLLTHGSIKAIHRSILQSATYQMSSRYRDDAFQKDGDNRFLWRMNPRRLDVESWRDAMLSVTGELELDMGGPPTEDVNSRKRTVYFKVSRLGDRFQTDQLLRMFDFPIMRATVAKRPVSIVPQQYLFMLNSNFMADRSRALASRLRRERTMLDQRIKYVYQLLYGREPSKPETQLALEFLNRPAAGNVDYLEKYCQVLLSSNEFFFIR